eukprot:CAMPEP_0113678206 /NCGR_PEP_ID=MMETSP0038_2-20120614/9784_1 /TAXON_ID=2898 /ORGANISM="Cryptomonas paramecium" /LENGTH=71 /DNA_ID=CAMNT_0000595749 /DNA_START=33 /DNA_END=248 /DNA_ORIENTATION=+ /assembly_acc=CAM_ASM_000170
MLGNQFSVVPGTLLASLPADWQFNRSYGWYGNTSNVGVGDYDSNRAAEGYDWYWKGPPTWVPGYSNYVNNA